MEIIEQTNRTILFDVVKPEVFNMFNIMSDVDENSRSLTDEKVAEINDALLVKNFDDFLKKYNKRINVEAKITLDGLAKYAFINMFQAGMNPIVIEQISGMKDINLSYCQRQAWEKSKVQLNRYVNSKIRGIDIYDNLGKGMEE